MTSRRSTYWGCSWRHPRGFKGEVRKNAAGHYLNGEPVSERPTGTLDADDLLLGRYLMLRKGWRRHHLVVVAD
ncbi:MAG: hypothetical protein M5U19_04895 [Microthrixaceae bacterium]|nr:hypothetical protein [Microthrixaceae bacterium]